MSLSPVRTPNSELGPLAAKVDTAVVLRQLWHPPAADPELVKWVTGVTVTAGMAARANKRIKINQLEVRVVNSKTMVARVPGFVMVIGVDHVMVKVCSKVSAVAANTVAMITAPGDTAVDVSVRDNSGCLITLVPAAGVPALMDYHGATNVAFRKAPKSTVVWNVPDAGATWREEPALTNGTMCQAVLRGRDWWVCPDCGYCCRHAESIWRHLQQNGESAPSIYADGDSEAQFTSAANAAGWAWLLDYPPSQGSSPMHSFTENTIADTKAGGGGSLPTPLAAQLRSRLSPRLLGLVQPSSHPSSSPAADNYRTAQQFYRDIGAKLVA